MEIKESLKIFDFHKGWTYILMIGMLLLLYESQWKYLTEHTLILGVQTSLTSPELLVLAGLTITFYTLLQQVIDRVYGDKEKYGDIKRLSSVLILANIFFVAICVIEIMISTLGLDSLRMNGFYLLLNSWVYNLIIIFFVITAPIFENALKNEWSRIYLNILYIGLIIFSLIRLTLIPM